MGAAQVFAQEKILGPSCGKCFSHELRLVPGYLLEQFLPFQAFHCRRCFKRSRKFHLNWPFLAMLLALISLGTGAAYLTTHGFLRRGGNNTASTELESLARARTGAGGRLSTFEEMMMKKPKTTLDNNTILKLWKAKVNSNVILQLIRTSNADYDLTADAVIALRQADVDQSIILSMIDASYGTRY